MAFPRSCDGTTTIADDFWYNTLKRSNEEAEVVLEKFQDLLLEREIWLKRNTSKLMYLKSVNMWYSHLNAEDKEDRLKTALFFAGHAVELCEKKERNYTLNEGLHWAIQIILSLRKYRSASQTVKDLEEFLKKYIDEGPKNASIGLICFQLATKEKNEEVIALLWKDMKIKCCLEEADRFYKIALQLLPNSTKILHALWKVSVFNLRSKEQATFLRGLCCSIPEDLWDNEQKHKAIVTLLQ